MGEREREVLHGRGRTGRLTPASDLDDQVALEDGAASQRLGRGDRLDRVVSQAEFGTQACARRTGQPAHRGGGQDR